MSLNDGIWRAKQLCELPNGRMGPQIVRRLRRNLGPSQKDSWCSPTGHWDPAIRAQFKDLVGQIFFSTNDRQLDTQDRGALDAALDYWRSYHGNFYRRTPVVFKFVGNADHRGNADYNARLSLQRATAVKSVFDMAFLGYPYYEAAAESLGESKATKADLAGSRRVDIFTNFVIPMHQKIEFENHVLEGKYRGERSRKFQMRSLSGGGVALGYIGANIMAIEILDPRTDRTAMYRLFSLSGGLGVGLNRPAIEFSDIDTKDFVTIDDFEGNGGIISVSAGVTGAQLLRFDGPKERGVTTKSIVLPTTGWDLNVGFSVDILGYWHRIGE